MFLKHNAVNNKERDKKQVALAKHILLTSFNMFPCFNYEHNHCTCILLNYEDLGYCLECVLRSTKYNVKGILVKD